MRSNALVGVGAFVMTFLAVRAAGLGLSNVGEWLPALLGSFAMTFVIIGFLVGLARR